jgi:hypothetical protein
MSTPLLQYISGEEVHAGDRIQFKELYGTVVFVNHGESEESQPGYEDNSGREPGVVICDDDGETSDVGLPNEYLSFLGRA